ncbi:magnesium chelatase [Comamonas testosteroni]|uniref:Magnesium chelatase n=1 Tax=Comamonas testosteroni TaxID=285 RepID=A0A373F9L4_COMTE|nr:AAA family ATPase [Comamonas testosteroni]RGE40109.1 magnesium chelatase [Comamonas testosteroni]
MSHLPINDVINFPFTAIEGQPQLQLALLLLAVDPLLGGVLVEGPRGTAKSTSARALADLLPAGRFVNLPLGTTAEQLQGSLDLRAALQNAEVQFKPGLLAQAHQGMLYVDEVNLLPDGLVDLLLDVSASGINRVERDGVSHQHAARIALVGTMNPEEGQLRPQLLDRFGLFVRLANVQDAATRKRIVQTRMAFDADPAEFAARYAMAQAALLAQISAAQNLVSIIAWPDAVFDQVAHLCQQAQVEGVRADLVMLRAARAHAALEGRDMVAAQDVNAVAELALAHRRNAAAPQEKEAQPESQSAAQSSAEQPSSGTNEGKHSPAADGWGGMEAPQKVPTLHLKELRPFQTKKA